MNPGMNADEVLDREYLVMRCKLIEVAAALDRIERCGDAGAAANDARMKRLREAIHALDGTTPGKAEKLQMLFSLDYDGEWPARAEFRGTVRE